ncbi:MAG TPA: hemolysin family protein [Cyclobacteriaceae bacterium]
MIVNTGWWILTTLVLSAFFAGAGIALPASAKPRQGQKVPARIAAFVTRNRFIFEVIVLTGSTVSLVAYGLFMAQLTGPLLARVLPPFLNHYAFVLVIQILVATLIVVFTAAALRSIMLMLPLNGLSRVLSIPFLVCYVLLYPLAYAVAAMAKFVATRMFGLPDPGATPAVAGLGHPAVFPRAGDSDVENRIIHNAEEFKSVLVRECMIPRTEIVAVELGEGIEKLKEAFIESGHSKIIVYKDTIDDVIGYCHSSALFRKPRDIRDILTSIIVVPETTLANELMIKFINERRSLAVVLDEFGGTSGIVSMEDVIEEILGDIEDEHDEDNLIEQKLDEDTYLLSARLEIDYLNDTYGWSLPEGDYETLGGLILTLTEDIPEPGETVQLPPFTFTIQSTLENRIDVVRLTLTRAGEEAAQDS